MITLLNPFVDFFICETISSINESSHVLNALKNTALADKKIWLSWTLLEDKNCRLRSGESIEDAFNFAEKFNPDAYLFNCTDPDAITQGLKTLKKLTDKPIGAYPNVFGVPYDWTLDNKVEVDPRNLTVEQFVQYKNVCFQIPGAEDGDGSNERVAAKEFLEDLSDTLYYSDVTINTASTMSLDAIAHDKPVINIAFDMVDKPYFKSVERYYEFVHYQPIIDSNATSIAKNKIELYEYLESYILDMDPMNSEDITTYSLLSKKRKRGQYTTSYPSHLQHFRQ